MLSVVDRVNQQDFAFDPKENGLCNLEPRIKVMGLARMLKTYDTLMGQSAKGAKYESQGQALSGAKRVAPGQYDIP